MRKWCSVDCASCVDFYDGFFLCGMSVQAIEPSKRKRVWLLFDRPRMNKVLMLMLMLQTLRELSVCG